MTLDTVAAAGLLAGRKGKRISGRAHDQLFAAAAARSGLDGNDLLGTVQARRVPLGMTTFAMSPPNTLGDGIPTVPHRDEPVFAALEAENRALRDRLAAGPATGEWCGFGGTGASLRHPRSLPDQGPAAKVPILPP